MNDLLIKLKNLAFKGPGFLLLYRFFQEFRRKGIVFGDCEDGVEFRYYKEFAHVLTRVDKHKLATAVPEFG
jgi:hypothetical protein